MLRKRGYRGRIGWVLVTFAAVTLVCGVLPAPVVKTRKMVALDVTAVRGSKEGEESVDVRLGELGDKLKEKFKVRRLEVIDTVKLTANTGWEITTSLGSDMTIKMKWRGVRGNEALFRLTVLRNKETLISSDMRMQLDQPAVTAGKLDKDILILVAKAQLDTEWEDD